MVDAVAGKFSRAGSDKNMVTLQPSIDDLGNDLLVGEAYDKAVFGCVT
jgi:hypothetical protein